MFLGVFDTVFAAFIVWKQCRIVCGNFEVMIGVRVMK
jgi:hypothetical protein